MPRKTSSSDSRSPMTQDTDMNYASTEIMHTLNVPCVKQILHQRAWEQWNLHKNEKYAIFYQTISFCMLSSSTSSHHQHHTESSDLTNYIERINSELVIEKPKYNYSNFEDINKYLEREISTVCRHNFPKEWTVIQLCKNYNPTALSSRHEEIVQYNTGVSMTIFKHAAVKDMLFLDIKKQSQLENVFEKAHKIAKRINEGMTLVHKNPANETEERENREKYWKSSKENEALIQETIMLLTSFIGPWKVLLTGNFKNRKTLEVENEIKKEVYKFLGKKSFSPYQEKLIYSIARRVDLLSNQQIFVAITYILQDKPNLGYKDIDLNDLYDHLTWIKQEFKYEDKSTYPVILIVDELLDQLPFEMINTQQEFTRVCSFSGLRHLFERHSSSIDSNGYVMRPINNCQGIVNPDGTLKSMEERMRNFCNYWLPSWNFNYGQMPSKESFYDILSQSDVFVYCGHGSGFTYEFNEDIFDLKTNAVIMLFGCGSTGLTSAGLCSEMKGAHVYYHLGNAPTVIGFLWTVTDFHTDVCSSKILSGWIKSSSSKPHWQLIDKQLWKKNGNLAFTKTVEIISSESLSEVITKIHNDTELPISIRSALVYRGLPVIATDSSNSIQNSSYKY